MRRAAKSPSWICAALVAGVTTAHADPEQALLARAVPHVVAWRRELHQHPELGNRETRTAKLVAEQLRKLGLVVQTGVAHTGVVAILKGGRPGPRVALRADMDALPVTEQTGLPFASMEKSVFRGERVGVMHACGHDAHTAILLGAAEVLASMRAELPGEVLFLFQPAEEGAPDGETGGAAQMLAEGVFAQHRPAAVFGLHVWSALNAGQIGYRAGPAMAAADRFHLVVHGRQTHGSRPWGGVDPILVAAEIVTASQSIVSRRIDLTRDPAVLSFGAIKGGVRYNIIPDEVELIGTVRSFDERMRQQIFAELRRTAEHVAAAHGASVDAQIPDEEGDPVLVNDPALTARMRPTLERVAGTQSLVEMPLVTGGEDFSRYAREVPGLFVFIGATAAGQDAATAPMNHSPRFVLDESALAVGTRALVELTLDYLRGR